MDRCVALQLTAEGGWDAAQEAPFVYAAMDALASRAGSWAEHQQRIRIENAGQQAASQMAEPVVIARQTVDFVKQVSWCSQICEVLLAASAIMHSFYPSSQACTHCLLGHVNGPA